MIKHCPNYQLFAGLLLCLCIGCENEMKEIEAITNARELPVQTSIKAHYRITEKGRLTHELIAQQINIKEKWINS
jgi:hypothetical protein